MNTNTFNTEVSMTGGVAACVAMLRRAERAIANAINAVEQRVVEGDVDVDGVSNEQLLRRLEGCAAHCTAALATVLNDWK